MPFFEEQQPPVRRRARRRLRRDDHYGRPSLFVPSYLPADVVLAVSDEVAVVMHGIACYPRGFAFSLETTTRYEVSSDDEEADRESPFGHWRPSNTLARFGIEYSDGRRATLRDAWPPPRSKGSSERITIERGGGGGGGGRWTNEMWVQPLPPEGPVTFVVAWQSMGIGETLQTLDGERFREAAGRATRVFPPRRPARPVSTRS